MGPGQNAARPPRLLIQAFGQNAKQAGRPGHATQAPGGRMTTAWALPSPWSSRRPCRPAPLRHLRARSPERALVADRRAVAGVEAHAVDLDRALGRHQVAEAVLAEFVLGRSRRPSGSGRARGHWRGSAARPRRRRCRWPASRSGRRGRPSGRAWRPRSARRRAASGMIQIWKIRVVPGSRLYSACWMPVPALITCTSPASVRPRVAQVVLVRDRAFADVGDDLHVRVRVRREAGLGGDGVVVPDPQRAPAHALRRRGSRRRRSGAWRRANRGWLHPGCRRGDARSWCCSWGCCGCGLDDRQDRRPPEQD